MARATKRALALLVALLMALPSFALADDLSADAAFEEVLEPEALLPAEADGEVVSDGVDPSVADMGEVSLDFFDEAETGLTYDGTELIPMDEGAADGDDPSPADEGTVDGDDPRPADESAADGDDPHSADEDPADDADGDDLILLESAEPLSLDEEGQDGQEAQDGVMPASNASIVESGTCGANLTWALDEDGVLTISGTGAMDDYSNSTPAPWEQRKSSVTTVVMATGVTSVGN